MELQLKELYGRLALCDAAIQMMRESDDPRALDALVYYQGQREELACRIQASNPPPVAVQCDAGRLNAKEKKQL